MAKRHPDPDRGPPIAISARGSGAERAPLTLTPILPVSPARGPLVYPGDQWQNDPSFDLQPLLDPGAPMGLNLEPSDQPTLEPRPGPGTVVPKMLTVLGAGWLLWIVWSLSARIARRAPTSAFVRAGIVAILSAFRALARPAARSGR